LSEEPNIKNLIGSMNYGIELQLIESLEKLDNIYVNMLFYYRKRKIYEIIVDDFQSLIDEITVFWEEEAKMPIFPRKIAAWLSDYLKDVGHPNFDFESVLNKLEVKKIEKTEDAMVLKIIENRDPEIKPKMKKVEMELPEKVEDVVEFLSEEIDKHLVEVPKTMESSILFIDPDGKISSVKAEQEIIKAEDSDINLSSTTVFQNPLDVSIHNVQVNNVVPFGYKVVGYDTIGFEGIKPKKKLLDDGLRLTWTIPEVKPKQETKIEVNLERRIARTILMNIGDETNVMNTYFSIEQDEEIYSASNSFVNIQSSFIDNLIIEDEIPTTFNIIEAKPLEDKYTVNAEKENFEQLIKWKYSSFEAGKRIEHLYRLTDNVFLIINHFLITNKGDNTPLLKIIRLIEPNTMFKELVVSYYLEFLKPMSEIYIREVIPDSLNITFQFPNIVERTFEVMQEKSIQSWRIFPKIGDNKLDFGYICSGEIEKNVFPFEIFIKDVEISAPNETSTESNKGAFHLPLLHEFITSNKKSK